METASTDESAYQLSLVEKELIAFFVHAAQAAGLARSIGEIYGLYFASEGPLALDQVIAKLKISKGSASQGIRFLKNINALKSVYLPGDRREFYEVETSLRRIAEGFIKERALPHLSSGNDRLEHLRALIDSDHQHIFDRINTLSAWSRKAQRLIPYIIKFLAAPK